MKTFYAYENSFFLHSFLSQHVFIQLFFSTTLPRLLIYIWTHCARPKMAWKFFKWKTFCCFSNKVWEAFFWLTINEVFKHTNDSLARSNISCRNIFVINSLLSSKHFYASHFQHACMHSRRSVNFTQILGPLGLNK